MMHILRDEWSRSDLKMVKAAKAAKAVSDPVGSLAH
jgi:hypothetical protein